MMGMRAATQASKRYDAAVRLQCFVRVRQAKRAVHELRTQQRLQTVIRRRIMVREPARALASRALIEL